MSRLTRREYKILCQIFKMSETQLRKSMEKIVRQYYPEENVVATEDYIYAWGDIPIGLVAHLDTVHKQLPREIFHDDEAGVIWSPEGIGADDRAGVYAILSLLQDGYRPTVIFCTQEECGGLGAEELVQDIIAPLSPLSFLIELDRRGVNDMVFYDCDNPEFEAYIETFGFRSAWGSFSDISNIAPAWEVAAVNLSIGYDDEHTSVERLYYRNMLTTMDKVRKILEAEGVEQHPFKYIPGISYPYCSSVWGNDDYGYKYLDTATGVEMLMCDGCETFHQPKDIKHIYDGGSLWRLCPDCVKTLTRKCKKCGNRFIPWDRANKTETLCPSCQRKAAKVEIETKGEVSEK